MRYPLTHQARRSLIVVVFLIAIGALATAAAHVSRSGSGRGDISLVDPVPDRAPATLSTGGSPTVAPLFAGRPAAAQVAQLSGEGVSSFVRSEAAARRFSLVPENRAGSSSYRDFAGERTRNLQTRSASGGGASAGGGGVGGGGGFGGRAEGDREPGAGPAARASSAARSSSRSGSSGGSRAAAASSGPGATVVTLPATASPTAVVAVGTPGVGSPLGSSPGASPTPEPLTLLLVGSGLAGLYGARKHLAG